MSENRQIRKVSAAIHGIGKFRVHTSIFDIAETLLERWPVPEEEWGEAHLHARRVCMWCYEGKCTGEEARDAFILALDEAGISIMNEDREPPYPVEPAREARRKRVRRDRGATPSPS